MTDWMLYHFAKSHNELEIKHRLDWLTKQGNHWLSEVIETSNKKAEIDRWLETADQQVKCYASQVNELTDLAHSFGKLADN